MSDSEERLINRLTLLESRLRRTRILGAVALLVVGGVLLAGAQAPTLSVVEAREFVLRDSEGRLRGRLTTDASPLGGPALVFYDEEVSERVTSMPPDPRKPPVRERLAVPRTSLGPYGLYLSAREGRGSASMVAQDTGGQIILQDATGKGGIEILFLEGHGPTMTWIDADQNIRGRFEVDRTEPFLKMVGTAGKVLFQEPMPEKGVRTNGTDSR